MKYFFTWVLFIALVSSWVMFGAQQVLARATTNWTTIETYESWGYTCIVIGGSEFIGYFIDCTKVTYSTVLSSYSATQNDYRTLTGYANYTTVPTTDYKYFAIPSSYSSEGGAGAP